MADPARILVVDDQVGVRDILRIGLTRAGYEVETAEGVDSAFGKLEDFGPDLILLDVMMPSGTEGFQFVWRLRNEGPAAFSDTPILMLSGIHSTTELRFYPEETDGTYKAGEFLPVQGFIDKPVDMPVLLAKIEEVLAGGKG